MNIEEKMQAIFDRFCEENGVIDYEGLPDGDRVIVLDEFKRWIEEIAHECSSGTA